MSKFSVGQKVICIRDNTSYCKDIIVGQEYTVDALTYKYIYVRNIHGKISGGWELNRFKAKEEVTTAKSLPATDLEKCPDTHIDVSNDPKYITKDTDIFSKRGCKYFTQCEGGYAVSQCKDVKIFALKENYEEHQKLLAKALVDIKLPPDMIEVTHLKEYCPKGGDVYLTESANTTYPITSFYAVKHWRPTTRIWATKENYNRYKEDCRHNEYMPMNVKVEKKDEISEVSSQSATKSIGEFVGRISWNSLNYFIFEPTKEIASRAIQTVRYVTLVSVIAGSVYAYKYPETFWKCLPKISVSIEVPEIING